MLTTRGSESVRALIIADFTVAGLAPRLADPTDPPIIESVVAPFDQVSQTLLDDAHPGWAGSEIAVVWTRPQRVSPGFARVTEGEPVDVDDVAADVDAFAERLRRAAGRVAALFVPTWTWPAHDRGLGPLSLDPRVGPAAHLLRMNLRLVDALADTRNVFVLDAARWQALAGPGAQTSKLWHLGKIAFGPAVLGEAARDIKAAVRALRGRSRKLVILDLDDTLWGGTVGETGWEGLTLGGHDPVGEAFVEFQRGLKRLTRRGIVLAIASKNDPRAALEAIDRHPEMILRRDDFVAWRIDWNDKAQNIADLVSELQLGLDAAVFLDDHPAERARVREALPDVLVPEWPADKLLYAQALAELRCFDTVAISDEDRRRTRAYVSERQRATLRTEVGSLDAYLASLDVRVTWEPLGPDNAPRAAQLLNKTNQWNLRTRRLGETEYLEWADATDHETLVFRVGDRFDDYGLTGVASLSVAGGDAFVEDLVLSCRVMGRGVEEAILHVLSERARERGAERLVAACLPTARNGPCRDFLAGSALSPTGRVLEYAWALATPYPARAHVAVAEADRAAA